MTDIFIFLDELTRVLDEDATDFRAALYDDLYETEEHILTALGNTSGTAGLDTILSKVNEINTAVGKSVFKSWHRYVFSNSANTSMGTITLTESVDPTRCIILSERLRNTTDQTLLYDYVLTDSKITVSHQTLSGTDQLRLGFTVVELY